MDVKKIENFLRKKDDTVKKDSSILSKWENEINYFLDKNIKQKIIIEFIFENDEEIKNKYINNYTNIQSMMSKFCAKLKKSKKRKKDDSSSKVNSNSSQSSKKEEPEKKSSDIVPQNSENMWTSMEKFTIKKN